MGVPRSARGSFSLSQAAAVIGTGLGFYFYVFIVKHNNTVS
jgi:hypothetical protein